MFYCWTSTSTPGEAVTKVCVCSYKRPHLDFLCTPAPLWKRSTSSSHSYGNAGRLEERNSERGNTITMCSHFPHSAHQSWQRCTWSMQGHLPRREVCLDAGTCCQPDVICLMLCRYCRYNDRITRCRLPSNAADERRGGKRCQERKAKWWIVESPVGRNNDAAINQDWELKTETAAHCTEAKKNKSSVCVETLFLHHIDHTAGTPVKPVQMRSDITVYWWIRLLYGGRRSWTCEWEHGQNNPNEFHFKCNYPERVSMKVLSLTFQFCPQPFFLSDKQSGCGWKTAGQMDFQTW